jgi:hypothetical protein
VNCNYLMTELTFENFRYVCNTGVTFFSLSWMSCIPGCYACCIYLGCSVFHGVYHFLESFYVGSNQLCVEYVEDLGTTVRTVYSAQYNKDWELRVEEAHYLLEMLHIAV